jgi:hypothetical protein
MFRAFLSQSSRGTVYKLGSGSSLFGMVSADADTIPRWLQPQSNLCTVPLEYGLKEPETCKAQVNKEISFKNLCITLVIIQFNFKMHCPYNIKKTLGILIHYADRWLRNNTTHYYSRSTSFIRY